MSTYYLVFNILLLLIFSTKDNLLFITALSKLKAEKVHYYF